MKIDLKKYLLGLVVLLTASTWTLASAEQLKIEIVTTIRDKGFGSVQVGEKSRQTINVDTGTQTLNPDFSTGVTKLGEAEFDSVRNGFEVTSTTFDGNSVSMTVRGQTASFFSIFGDIDYTFKIHVNTIEKSVRVSGCHNAFPSYGVFVNGKKIYDRLQTGTAVTGLIGTCDIEVDIDNISY